MYRFLQWCICCFLINACFVVTGGAQNTTKMLREKIQEITSDKKATVGVSLIGPNGIDTLSFHGDRHFPTQSVFKFHIALAVLAEVDKGKLSLEQEVHIRKDELLPEDFWSPLRDDNPEGGTFTLARVIQYMVIQSDNTACDVLIRLIGNPKTVETFCKQNKIRDIQITYNEKDMQARWENMFENWTTPKAASEILKIFYENKDHQLSQKSYDFFWKTNKETTTGVNRIRGLLPMETVVAHKTGSSGTHKVTGITEAVNNIGIVFLPDGRYFILSVFVSQSSENMETNERIIAEIAKAVYDHYKS